MAVALCGSPALALSPLPLSTLAALVSGQDDEPEDTSAGDAEAADGFGFDEESADGSADEAPDEVSADAESEGDTGAAEESVEAIPESSDEQPEQAEEAVAEPPTAPEPTPAPLSPPAAPHPITDRSAGAADPEDTRLYNVVMNHEEQYSIWLADRETPAGWSVVGAPCRKSECLARIEEIWTDMRPLSLRKKMEEAARQGGN